MSWFNLFDYRSSLNNSFGYIVISIKVIPLIFRTVSLGGGRGGG